MLWSLSLFLLLGHLSLFTGQLNVYHFVEEKMTWNDAQTYCREKHTDLATVYDMTDMRRLLDSAGNHGGEAWIGLYSSVDAADNPRWHWSLPGLEFSLDTVWFYAGTSPQSRYCVMMMKNYRLYVVSCAERRAFICYDATDPSNKFHLKEEAMTWPDALRHCRDHHTDLISGLNQLRDSELRRKISQSRISSWTIGLFRDHWKWSDEKESSFRNWDRDFHLGHDNKCAKTVLDKAGIWKEGDCGDKKPFFCYDVPSMTDKVILIKENKTWDEALYYCREHHDDLVTITNLDEQRWVQERAKNASTPYVWLGLRFTCALEWWFWVSDKLVTYENWASNETFDGCDVSAAMDTGGQHKWFSQCENKRFNFVCAV